MFMRINISELKIKKWYQQQVPLKKIYFLSFFCLFLCLCVCVTRVWGYPQRPEECFRSGTGVMGTCELCGGSEVNRDFLVKQSELNG